MASTSKKASVLPGRSALAGKPATRHPNHKLIQMAPTPVAPIPMPVTLVTASLVAVSPVWYFPKWCILAN